MKSILKTYMYVFIKIYNYRYLKKINSDGPGESDFCIIEIKYSLYQIIIVI